MSLRRLDHVIIEVPSIREAHARLTQIYPEAWPVGGFWPGHLTSGVAVGGINVELSESEKHPVEAAFGETLVFEPDSLELAKGAWEAAGIPCSVVEKIEPDPNLLQARGYSDEDAQKPQLICNNLYPLLHDRYPFGFFACAYSPFLKAWLSPEHPRLRTDAKVVRVLYGTTDPVRAQNLLLELGYAGDIEIEFTQAARRGLMRIETTAGPVPL